MEPDSLLQFLNRERDAELSTDLIWIDSQLKVTARVSYTKLCHYVTNLAESLLHVLSDDTCFKHPPVCMLVYSNSFSLLVALLACDSTGLVAVPTKMSDMTSVISDVEPEILLTSSDSGLLLSSIPIKQCIMTTKEGHIDSVYVDGIKKEYNTPAVLTVSGLNRYACSSIIVSYTGEPGKSQAKSLTISNIIANLKMARYVFDIDCSSTYLCCLPLIHGYILGPLLGLLGNGERIIIMETDRDTAQEQVLLQSISFYCVSHCLVPAALMYSIMNYTTTNLRDFNLSDINGLYMIYDEQYPSLLQQSSIKLIESCLYKAQLPIDTFRTCCLFPEHTSLLCSTSDCYLLESPNGFVPVGPLCINTEDVKVVIKVVDPVSLTCKPNGQRGEIWISQNPNICSNFKNKSLNIATLSCCPDYKYLRTGKQGIAFNGHLYLDEYIENPDPPNDKNISVFGMACHFPGCDTPQEFWDSLIKKEVHIRSISLPPNTDTHPITIYGAFTSAISRFDHKFFKIPLWELKTMDPQQTLALTTAWEALEDAGYRNMSELKGLKMGVFVGVCSNDARVVAQTSSVDNPLASGITPALIANRISYTFGLTGPSMTIDTSCASSLSALHVACQSLLSGDCESAIVGGVNGLLHLSTFSAYENLGMLSPTGESRVFDEKANGFVRGEGCGMVVLRLAPACHTGYATILSTATNHNGSSTQRIIVPSSSAQEELLQMALVKANLSLLDINYIEAHGTGTKSGDFNEMTAITNIFGSCTHVDPLYIGSVKANVGHLEGGAGIAGLIKTILVLKHKEVPANVGVFKLAKYCCVEERIEVPTEMVTYGGHGLLNACVNSFGFGGVNATAIIQGTSSLQNPDLICCHQNIKTVDKVKLQESILPNFYERFVLRRHVDHQIKKDKLSENDTDELQELRSTLQEKGATNYKINSPEKTNIEELYPEELLKPHLQVQDGNTIDKETKELFKGHILSGLLSEIQDELDDCLEVQKSEYATTHFFALGLDSVSLIQLIGYIQKKYGIKLLYTELLEMQTMDKMAEMITIKLWTPETSKSLDQLKVNEITKDEYWDDTIPRQESGYVSQSNSLETITELASKSQIPLKTLHL